MGSANSTDTDNSDNQLPWVQSILNEQCNHTDSTDCLFYFTGHHGIIWSSIISDSSGIHLYNGSTRNHIDYPENCPFDTLSFLSNNNQTITWGFDSLANNAQLLVPVQKNEYNPLYSELLVIKGNKTIFRRNGADYFAGPDSARFDSNFKKVLYLIFWLASPSCRSYIPIPCDKLQSE